MIQAGISGNKYDNISPKLLTPSGVNLNQEMTQFGLLVSHIYRVVLFYFYKLFKQGWHFLPVCIYFCSDKTGDIWIL